jgi:hypothetical protein
MAWWTIQEQSFSRAKEGNTDTNINWQQNYKGEEAKGKWVFFCGGSFVSMFPSSL